MNIKRAEARTGVRQAELPLDQQQLRKLAECNYADRFYNGFSPDERALLSRPQRAERYENSATIPLVCCVTGFSRPDDPRGAGYMFTHLEDYRSTLGLVPGLQARALPLASPVH
jgi:hypothetical protein